jgi:anionic glutamate receptor
MIKLFVQEYSMQITFREQWVDPRLAFASMIEMANKDDMPEFVVLPPGENIWMPDTFFPVSHQKSVTQIYF